MATAKQIAEQVIVIDIHQLPNNVYNIISDRFCEIGIGENGYLNWVVGESKISWEEERLQIEEGKISKEQKAVDKYLSEFPKGTKLMFLYS